MKRNGSTHRFFLFSILLALFLCLASLSYAEYGRVITPGGNVKMRKGAGKKYTVVCEIPNRAVVEIDESGEEWCHVIYGKKKGYIMTEYLRFSSQSDSALSIELNNTEPKVGEEIEIHVSAENASSFRYSLTAEKQNFSGTDVPFDTVYYCPSKTGIHCIEVTVSASDGENHTGEAFFYVHEQQNISSALSEIYSQKDGSWASVKYGSSNLSDSGCAIFTLAHGLRLLGYSGDDILPQNLAKAYGFCLVDGGTLNSTLIGRAGKNFGFKTQQELIKSKNAILNKFREGAVFSFAIVKSHIALAAAADESEEMVLIYDSAPSVTLERLQKGKMYLRDENGSYQEIKDLSLVPESKYYFVTDSFNGMCYYMDLDYVAKRGVRLIQPAD